MHTLRILVVEDDAVQAAYLCHILAQMGYEVAGIAATGENALTLAASQRPDLVLMDIRLAGEMDGLEAGAAIHRDLELPIVYLTAYTDEALVDAAKHARPYAYLVKPVRDHELRASIEVAVQSSAMDRQLRHLNRVVRAVRSINRLMATEKDAQRLLEQACRIVVDTCDYPLVWVCRVHPSQPGCRPAAVAGEATDLLDVLAAVDDAGQRARFPCIRTYRSREPVIYRDLMAEEDGALWRREALARGFLAQASWPIASGETVYGALCVASRHRWALDDEEAELLAELAGDLGLALHASDVEARRVQAEQALRVAVQSLDIYMANSRLAVVEFDRDYRVLRWSGAAEQMFGWRQDEIIGKAVSDLRWVYEEDSGPVMQVLADMLSGSRSRNVNVNRNYRKDGTIITCEWHNSAIYDEEGRLISALSLVLDITERARAIESLRKSEERLAFALDATADGVWDWNPATGESYDSLRMHTMLGYQPGEIGPDHQDWSALVHPDDLAQAEEIMENNLRQDSETHGAEFRMRHKDGSWRWILSRGRVVARDAEGRLMRVVGTHSDITARKESEERLRQSEERHRIILQSAMDGFWLADLEGRLLQVNEAYCRMSGYSERELLSMCISDLEMVETGADTAEHIRRIVATGEDRFHSVHRRRDGSAYDVEVSSRYQPIQGGRVATFLRDITERQQAQEAVARERDRAQRYLDVAGAMIVAIGPDYKVTLANRACCRRLELPESEIVGSDWFERFIPPNRREEVRGVFDGLMRGEVAPVEYHEGPVLTASGDQRTVLWHNTVIRDAAGAIVGSLSSGEDITERVRAEEALRQSEAQLANAVEMAHLGHWEYDAASDLFTFSDPFYRIFHTTAEQVGGYTMSWAEYIKRFVHPDDLLAISEATRRAAADPNPHVSHELTHRMLYADGTVGHIAVRFVIVRDAEGREVRQYGVNQDITERVRAQEEREKLQAQLLQAQKMESVGRLAGGVAHDFNNMLGVIIGHTELALEQVGSEHPLRSDLQQIRKAAQRSADLTRQLLAFARKQTVSPRVLDLNDAVGGTITMLQRLIGEDIELAWLPGSGLWPVKMDPGQVDQILANLCTNARDAISGVGCVTIETRNVVLSEADCANEAELTPGEYVMLAVRDDGCGMGPEVRQHLFEPFFTTKGVGQGTGLGLATVYGIVKQNQGCITVASAPGLGSTFSIYLPRALAEEAAPKTAAVARGPRGRGETVLLVEDEPAILNIGRIMLERLGYAVLSANSAEAGLRLAAAHAGQIGLLITDVVMPEMNGLELVERIRAGTPALKVLFMSGYTADVIAQRGVLEEGMQFIQKPFSIGDLANKVYEVLRSQ